VTAQVAVLNTNGIALASDSAVTITGGGQSRSYQSADKIFPIRGVPLAVLHSGNAALWGVPWQLLVDMWSIGRAQVQAVSVEAYAHEFSSWLTAQPALATEEAQDDFFRWTYRDYLMAVRGSIRRKMDEQGLEPAEGYVDGDVASIVDETIDGYTEGLSALENFRGMEKVDAEAICTRMADKLKEDLDWVFDDTPRTAHLDERASEVGRLLVHKAEPFATDAVLAFAGYGADDYFPSLYRMTISGAVGGVLRVYDDAGAIISAKNRVSINPLGLTEAIDAFLRGTSPQYRAEAHRQFDVVLGPQPEADPTEEDHEGVQDERAASHAGLDEGFDAIEWQQFLSPMLDIVENLPVAETLRLADSLVGLASLRQLIQGQSSVGGPVDLARVTKQGGFQWIRSKGGVNGHALTAPAADRPLSSPHEA
jgi:hypothetical protein